MFKFSIFCAIVFVKFANAAEFIIPPERKPHKFANQQGCYIHEFDKLLPFNMSYYPQEDNCLLYVCGTDGYTQVSSCGEIMPGPGCVIVEGDRAKRYPDCCDTVKCNEVLENTEPTESAEPMNDKDLQCEYIDF